MVLRQFESKEWIVAVQKEKVTHAFVVPTMMKQLLDHPEFATFDLASLENLAYGAAPMPFSEFCRQQMAGFKNPERIRFVDELPKNPLGKILRKELRMQHLGGSLSS